MMRAAAHAEGGADMVLLAGTSGVGKTALLEAILGTEGGKSIRFTARARDRSRPLSGARLLLEALRPDPVGEHVASTATALALQTALVAELQSARRIVAIDDAQWLDPESRAMLESALAQRLPVTVFIAERPCAVSEDSLYRFAVRIGPLGVPAATRLVRHVAPHLSPAVTNDIIRASDGIPSCLVLAATAACSGDTISLEAVEAMRSRVARETPEAAACARIIAAYDGPVPLHALAEAVDLPAGLVAEALDALADVTTASPEAVDYRIPALRTIVRSTDATPNRTARQVFDAELRLHDRSVDALRRLRQAARRSGETAEFVATSAALGRRLTQMHEHVKAVDILREAWEARPDLDSEIAREFLDALRVLGRDEEAVRIGHTMFRDAVSRGDGTGAVRIAGAIVHGLATLDRDTEIAEFLAAAARLPIVTGDPGAAGYLRGIALSNAAFDGDLALYDALASSGRLLPRDHRADAYARALRGDVEGSDAAFAAWRGRHGTWPLWDDNLDMHRLLLLGGPAACITWWEQVGHDRFSRDLNAAGSARIRGFSLIAAGRWDEAETVLNDVRDSSSSAEYRFLLLEVKLMLDTLRGVLPHDAGRVLADLRAEAAQARTRSTWACAAWLAAAMGRSGTQIPADILILVERGVRRWPRPYHLAAIPLFAYFAQPQLSERAAAAICAAAPRPGSRWLEAQANLARALLDEDNAGLRKVRDEFDALGAPAFAMVAGTALPAPRARDVALATVCGYGGTADTRARHLSERERSVAELAASGLSNIEIASMLCISDRTVETHLTNVYRKLDVRSRSGLSARLTL